MALVVTGRLNVNSSSGYGTGTYTTSSFTPSNSSLLYVVVGAMVNNTTGAPAITLADSLSSSWTEQLVAGRNPPDNFAIEQKVFTTPITSGASMTLTVDATPSINVYSVMAVDITGYNTSTPIGGVISSGGNTEIGDGAETETLSAAPTTNDITLVSLFIDGEDAPNPTYGAGSWTAVYNSADGFGSTCRSLGYRTASTSASVPITDVYTGAGSFFKGTMNSVVVQVGTATTKALPFPPSRQQPNLRRK